MTGQWYDGNVRPERVVPTPTPTHHPTLAQTQTPTQTLTPSPDPRLSPNPDPLPQALPHVFRSSPSRGGRRKRWELVIHPNPNPDPSPLTLPQILTLTLTPSPAPYSNPTARLQVLTVSGRAEEEVGVGDQGEAPGDPLRASTEGLQQSPGRAGGR